jgi:hypothetical protein
MNQIAMDRFKTQLYGAVAALLFGVAGNWAWTWVEPQVPTPKSMGKIVEIARSGWNR